MEVSPSPGRVAGSCRPEPPGPLQKSECGHRGLVGLPGSLHAAGPRSTPTVEGVSDSRDSRCDRGQTSPDTGRVDAKEVQPKELRELRERSGEGFIVSGPGVRRVVRETGTGTLTIPGTTSVVGPHSCFTTFGSFCRSRLQTCSKSSAAPGTTQEACSGLHPPTRLASGRRTKSALTTIREWTGPVLFPRGVGSHGVSKRHNGRGRGGRSRTPEGLGMC